MTTPEPQRYMTPEDFAALGYVPIPTNPGEYPMYQRTVDGKQEVVCYAVDPPEPQFFHTDIDGDWLGITTSQEPTGHRGVYFRTSRKGASVRLADIPGLIEKLNEIVALQTERGEDLKPATDAPTGS